MKEERSHRLGIRECLFSQRTVVNILLWGEKSRGAKERGWLER